MTNRTNLKAGGWTANHNETLVRDRNVANLKVKTRVRVGSSPRTFRITFNQQS